MTKHDAVKALNIYRRAGQQVLQTTAFSAKWGCLITCCLVFNSILGCSGWKSCWILWTLQRLGACKELSVSNTETGSLFHQTEKFNECSWLVLTLFCIVQPPPTFLATMEEYVKEAPQSGSVPKRLVRNFIHVGVCF